MKSLCTEPHTCTVSITAVKQAGKSRQCRSSLSTHRWSRCSHICSSISSAGAKYISFDWAQLSGWAPFLYKYYFRQSLFIVSFMHLCIYAWTLFCIHSQAKIWFTVYAYQYIYYSQTPLCIWMQCISNKIHTSHYFGLGKQVFFFFICHHVSLPSVIATGLFFSFCSVILMHSGEKIKAVLQRHILYVCNIWHRSSVDKTCVIICACVTHAYLTPILLPLNHYFGYSWRCLECLTSFLWDAHFIQQIQYYWVLCLFNSSQTFHLLIVPTLLCVRYLGNMPLDKDCSW